MEKEMPCNREADNPRSDDDYIGSGRLQRLETESWRGGERHARAARRRRQRAAQSGQGGGAWSGRVWGRWVADRRHCRG